MQHFTPSTPRAHEPDQLLTKSHIDHVDKWMHHLCQTKKWVFPDELHEYLPRCLGMSFFNMKSGAFASLPHVALSFCAETAHAGGTMLGKHFPYLVFDVLFDELDEPKVCPRASLLKRVHR